MTSDEIRKAFLDFFEEKGHTVIPSSSLVPQGDPTLLLTTAGMVQIKPYFMGEAVPPNPRLASCQKCFRTTDIDSVGDRSHLTFFEMLGNFSVGDYFKKEAISWAWEFLTDRLKLPPERLWITVYTDDDESFEYWRQIGIPERKIFRFGEKHNFWGPAGKTGPCGPCSEIHYDFGEEFGCGQPTCAPNCDCGRFSEIWNLVFTQYNQDEQGRHTSLPRPNIDTGMGLERITAVKQGKNSVYETDLFRPLLERISGLAGIAYGSNPEADNAMRVIAEHSRGIAFLIVDGVIPANEGRGYVLRRLLRRAVLYGRRLGQEQPFLKEAAQVTIKLMHDVYHELSKRQQFIIKVIELEEARFKETLNTGLDLIELVVAKDTTKSRKQISGEDAFKLYDTYGFPVEVTSEIVARSGFSVDLEGFEKEMEKQRERARSAHKFELEIKGQNGLDELDIRETGFVGYESLKHKSVILKLMVDNKPVNSLAKGQKASIILDMTPFYGEMGGQVGDTGEIKGAAGSFSVTNTVRVPPDIIVHEGYLAEGGLSVGEEVEAQVDRERRLDIARNHTATHLLQSALRRVLGEHVQQRGSLVAPERLRFDFSHLEQVTQDEIKKIEQIVNEEVRRNLKVNSEETSYKKAIAEGAIALFNEKYGDVVRLMKIGEPAVSAELCGGTHITSTGEIGYFHIIGESSIGAGLRRIEAVTGREAEKLINQRLSTIEDVARTLGASPDKLQEKLTGVLDELDTERKRKLALEKDLALKEAESLIAKAEDLKGIKLVASRVSVSNQQILREMADFIRDKLKSGVVVLGAVDGERPIFLAAVTPDLVSRGYNAGEIIKQVAKVAGGGGGGKAGLAQAGGKYKEKLDEALSLVKSLI